MFVHQKSVLTNLQFRSSCRNDNKGIICLISFTVIHFFWLLAAFSKLTTVIPFTLIESTRYWFNIVLITWAFREISDFRIEIEYSQSNIGSHPRGKNQDKPHTKTVLL